MHFCWNLYLLTCCCLFRDLPFSTINLLIFLSFIVFLVRRFFLLSHFLVIQDYELSKSTGHRLTVPLTLVCARILSWSTCCFFYFHYLHDAAVCKIAIWVDDANHQLMWQTIWLFTTNWDSLTVEIKNQNCQRKFLFFISWFLILNCQDLVLKLSIQAQTLEAFIRN